MMKPFKLKEYLKDRNKEVVTREGKPVKILCVNLISDKPIVAEIIGRGYSLAYDIDGSHTSYQSPNDIFFKTTTKKKWINLYRSGDGSGVYTGGFLDSKEVAESTGKKQYNYIKTFELEWEE